MEKYLSQVQALGYKFIELLAEAFGLSSDALARFYDSDELMQHRGKVGLLPLTCYLHDCIRV
jgi:isopenicillin N synthase-like dioxygenase